jgi:hypothetical protein
VTDYNTKIGGQLWRKHVVNVTTVQEQTNAT